MVESWLNPDEVSVEHLPGYLEGDTQKCRRCGFVLEHPYWEADTPVYAQGLFLTTRKPSHYVRCDYEK